MEKSFLAFRDLNAWKAGHTLTLEIYRLTQSFPQEERFGIIAQLRRASSSITANIAEGYARYHFKDKSRFYYQSRGSAAEVQNFIQLAIDLGYADRTKGNELIEKVEESIRLINGLINSVKNR